MSLHFNNICRSMNVALLLINLYVNAYCANKAILVIHYWLMSQCILQHKNTITVTTTTIMCSNST